MTLDHLIDLADGGTNADSNLVLACSPCNHDRGKENERLRALLREVCYPADISQIIAAQTKRRL